MSRWTKFLIAVLLGTAAGMFYGWYLNPVEYVDIAPGSLRSDFKTDYVMMIAESYQVDHNLGLAVRRLSSIGSTTPASIVENALGYALQHEYLPQYLSLLQSLDEDLQSWNPNLEVPTP